MVTMTGQESKKLQKLIVEAIEVDGEQHKQWYLIKIAELIDIPIEEFHYKKGVKP